MTISQGDVVIETCIFAILEDYGLQVKRIQVGLMQGWKEMFQISSKITLYMHHPTDRIVHATAFVTAVVEH